MTLTEFLTARLDGDRQWALDQIALRGALPYGEANPGHPKRVLAEIDARRRIVEWCDKLYVNDGDAIQGLLALPYGSHPDYDEAWRP